MSFKKEFLSLAALGLLAASFHASNQAHNVPGIGDRDFGGHGGHDGGNAGNAGGGDKGK